MQKKIDIQTILRDRMVFMCNSICHMLGEDMTRWSVLLDENDGLKTEIQWQHIQKKYVQLEEQLEEVFEYGVQILIKQPI